MPSLPSDSSNVILHRGRLSHYAATLMRADAFTLGRHVFLSKTAAFEIAGRSASGTSLLAHEMVHVEQYRRRGVTRFLARYFGEYLVGRARGRSHRESYLAIGFEREAREASAASASSGEPGDGAPRATSGSPADLPRGA